MVVSDRGQYRKMNMTHEINLCVGLMPLKNYCWILYHLSKWQTGFFWINDFLNKSNTSRDFGRLGSIWNGQYSFAI